METAPGRLFLSRTSATHLEKSKDVMIILHLVIMMRLMVLVMVIISYLVIAMEVSGVVGAPFQTIVLPHDIAKAEFQP